MKPDRPTERQFQAATVIGCIIGMLLLLLATQINKCSASDWQYPAIATVVSLYDCLQTIEIANNPNKWYEINPKLGDHPSEFDVKQYFAVCTAINLCTWYALDNLGYHNAAKYLELGIIGFEAILIGNNLSIGLRGSF